MQKRFDVVIFDLDGTLIDNRFAIRENFNYTLETYGYRPLPPHEIDRMIGTPLLEMFEITLPEEDKRLAPQLVDTWRERYHYTSHQGVVILEGVITTLEYLQGDGFKLAVATAKADDEVHPLLQRIGLYGYFDLVTGFGKKLRAKPYPDTIHYIMEELGSKPQRTTLVGDTPKDVMTARNAGIYSIIVTSSVPLGMTSIEKIYDAQPCMVISSLRELPEHLYL